MPEIKHSASQFSEDLSSSRISRVGIFAALVATALSEGCGRQQPVEPLSSREETAVPVDPLVAESDLAFQVGTRMGKESLVYFNASGRHATYFSHSREFSVNELGTKEQGGLVGWDVSVSDKEKPLPFTKSDFEAWRKTQMADLQNRSDIKERLQTPGSGILLSTDGSVFLTFLNGSRVEVKQLGDEVTPLVIAADQ